MMCLILKEERYLLRLWHNVGTTGVKLFILELICSVGRRIVSHLMLHNECHKLELHDSDNTSFGSIHGGVMPKTIISGKS